MAELKSYDVWDAPTRWFHWINALCIIGLIAVGLVILNAGSLDVSNKGKIALKTVHVYIGYVFVLNFLGRIVWAFAGNHYAQWRQILPGGRGYIQALRNYVSAFAAGRPEHYLGHNPLGRISVAVLFALIAVQAFTGLVLAGTDIFFPPFGAWVAQSIAAPGVDSAALVPYAPELYDKLSYDNMRAIRKPFATVHLYGLYALLITVVLHIAAVVVTELREGGSIVSAMFTGRKVVSAKPVDSSDQDPDALP